MSHIESRVLWLCLLGLVFLIQMCAAKYNCDVLSGEFTCNNGNCIDKLFVCDDDDDCRDNSDEWNCAGRSITYGTSSIVTISTGIIIAVVVGVIVTIIVIVIVIACCCCRGVTRRPATMGLATTQPMYTTATTTYTGAGYPVQTAYQGQAPPGGHPAGQAMPPGGYQPAPTVPPGGYPGQQGAPPSGYLGQQGAPPSGYPGQQAPAGYPSQPAGYPQPGYAPQTEYPSQVPHEPPYDDNAKPPSYSKATAPPIQ